jgi:hypothetical protein
VAAKLPSIPTIARIINVRDTRDRIEVGDRWVPVPGSGDLRPCDRCCREHEIHVDVELSDGRSANIGSGCAKGETMEVQSRLKSAISAAKTRSRLSAELALAKDEHTRALAAWREVEALSPPPPELVEEITDAHGRSPRQVWRMDDVNVWTTPGSSRGFDAERRQALLNAWRSKRYRERGFELPPYSYEQKADDLADRLAKIESKVSALMF